MEIPRLGVKSELQLRPTPQATARPDPSCICDLYHSLQQHWMRPGIEPSSSQRQLSNCQVFNVLSHSGNSQMTRFIVRIKTYFIRNKTLHLAHMLIFISSPDLLMAPFFPLFFPCYLMYYVLHLLLVVVVQGVGAGRGWCSPVFITLIQCARIQRVLCMDYLIQL